MQNNSILNRFGLETNSKYSFTSRDNQHHRSSLMYVQGMLSAFVCLPKRSRKSAGKADKMGISRKLVLGVSEQEIWEIGRDYKSTLTGF